MLPSDAERHPLPAALNSPTRFRSSKPDDRTLAAKVQVDERDVRQSRATKNSGKSDQKQCPITHAEQALRARDTPRPKSAGNCKQLPSSSLRNANLQWKPKATLNAEIFAISLQDLDELIYAASSISFESAALAIGGVPCRIVICAMETKQGSTIYQ